MLGKKESLVELKKYLVEEKNITNVTETQFCQGHTMRWAIAWSFHDFKLNDFNYFKSVIVILNLSVWLIISFSKNFSFFLSN